MVSTFFACLWAVIGILMGGAWGILTMGLIHAAKDKKKEDKDNAGSKLDD